MVEDSPINLLDMKTALELFEVHFDDKNNHFILISRNNMQSFIAEPTPVGKGILYKLVEKSVPPIQMCEGVSMFTFQKPDVYRIHEVLNHISKEKLSKAFRGGNFVETGLTLKDIKMADFSQCVGCIRGKMDASHKLHHLDDKAKIGEVIHGDLFFIPDKNGKPITYLITLDSRTLYIC